MIDLGDRVRDAITGFSGVVVAKTTWLHGCDRLIVQPEGLDKGKLHATETFDELQLVLVKKAVVAATRGIAAEAVEAIAGKVRRRLVGGPRDDKAAARRP